MKMNQQIQEFNKKLIDINIFDINIIDYIKAINDEFYKIDINFIDDFINLVDKDECCINHELLKKYGVSQLSAGSADIKKILDRNKAHEGLDYTVSQLADCDDYSHKIEYKLHPTIFKKILIRSQNTEKYTDYYLMLEKCIKYYNDFQIMKLEKIIQENNKIKLLKLKNADTWDNFIIFEDLRNKSYPYGTIKGSDKNVRETLIDLKLTEDNIVLQLKVPSQQNFNKKIKEMLKDKYTRQKFHIKKDTKVFVSEENLSDDDQYIVSTTRYFKLTDITIDEFIEKLNEIDKLRYNN